MEEVQSQGALWNEAVPEVNRKVGVGAAEPGNEMVFVGADGSFGGVAAMVIRRDKLEVNAFRSHVGFQDVRAFIIKAL